MPFRRSFSTAFSLLVVLALAFALIPAGCAPRVAPEPAWELQANDLLNQAESYYSKRQYELANRTIDDFFLRYPKSRHGDRAFQLKGEMRLAQRDYRQALGYYKEIIERYPASPLIPDAKYQLGRCYFELKEYDLAIANLQDRSRITDPVKLRTSAEMLSAAYLARKNYAQALGEYVYLAQNANPRQQAGYRDRIRELIEKNLTPDELKTIAAGSSYPADLALLRLAAVQIEQRSYRDAAKTAKDFLDRFPSHPEKTRAEMLLNEANTKLSSPRYAVGLLMPQSGQLALFADRIVKGVQLAANEYNQQEPDNRVELQIRDTEGSPEKAVTALKDLASQGVVAGIGPVTTRDEEAISPVLDALHIPFVRPVASRSGFSVKTPWLYRNALTIDSQAQAAAEYAVTAGLQRFVIFYPDEPYGRDLFHLFSKELEHKAEIVASIAYPPDTKDFGPYIRKVMEIDLRSRKIVIPEDEAERKKLFAEYIPGFDALYLPGYAERVGLLIPQLAYYNISNLAMIGSDNWHSPDLIERAGKYAEGAVFVDGFFPESQDPVVKTFVEAYRSAYREDPDILAAQAYDAAMMIFFQLKQHRETATAIRDGLAEIKDYPGITGTTTFAGNQEARKKLFLIKIRDGAFTLAGSEQSAADTAR
jgi:branched-chain amino acid transport system substrate-binding protein